MPYSSLPVLSRPARIPSLGLARYPVTGALAPEAATVAHAALPATVPLLVFLAVLATEMTPPTRQEAGMVLLILVVTATPGFLLAHAASAWLGLPGDLALAAAVVAASPVSIMCGVFSQSFGLPARPAVWAALLGLVCGPVVLPVAAALGGGAGVLDPTDLAGRRRGCARRGERAAVRDFQVPCRISRRAPCRK